MEMQSPCNIRQVDTPKPEAVLEALLFLSGRPMEVAAVCAHTGWSPEQTETAAQALEASLAGRGIMLLRVAGGYQLVTRPELYDAVQWVQPKTADLSPTAMEVLAIIAFKQPLTRADIEKLRGVSSERIISSLIQQGLIVELGRRDTPGRPIIYGTSPYFLECMGMNSLDDLAGRMPSSLTEEEADELEVRAPEDSIQEVTDGKATEGHE